MKQIRSDLRRLTYVHSESNKETLSTENILELEQINKDSLAGYIETFISESDRSRETMRVYKQALRKFAEWADNIFPTTSVIRIYKSCMLNAGLEPNTVSVYMTAINQYFDYLVEQRHIPYNPAKVVRRPRIPRTHQRDPLTAEDARLLLNNIPRVDIKGYRDYAMVNLMLRTGVREVEVSKMLISDITSKEGERIIEIHGKGRDCKDSFVVLTVEAYEPIAEYLALRIKGAISRPLFGSVGNRSRGNLSTRAIRSIISKYLKIAGLKTKRVTPHSLRHTAITLALKGGNGLNLLQVQQMARHVNISSTLVYVREYERMKNAAERCIKI
jgi:integrase/recombinase XerC/integrase/recombinase XerD